MVDEEVAPEPQATTPCNDFSENSRFRICLLVLFRNRLCIHSFQQSPSGTFFAAVFAFYIEKSLAKLPQSRAPIASPAVSSKSESGRAAYAALQGQPIRVERIALHKAIYHGYYTCCVSRASVVTRQPTSG